jgi:hypothetical protein
MQAGRQGSTKFELKLTNSNRFEIMNIDKRITANGL